LVVALFFFSVAHGNTRLCPLTPGLLALLVILGPVKTSLKGCLFDKSLVSHLASLIPLAKHHHLLVLHLTIWWLLSLFSVWLMARQDSVFIDTWNTCSVGITGSWQNLTQRLFSWQIIGLPSGVTDSFGKTSPSSCPLLNNLVVALFSVWLMARQDCVYRHLEYLLCWRYWLLAKPHSKLVFLTNHWSPIWHYWFLWQNLTIFLSSAWQFGGCSLCFSVAHGKTRLCPLTPGILALLALLGPDKTLLKCCLLDKSLVSHLASLIPLAKPHHLLVLHLTIWWLLSLFQCGSWRDKTVSIDTWYTCSVGVTGSW